MAVISGSDTKSGIVSLPVKVQRARYDQSVQAYPTIRRTGDHGYLNRFDSPFSDTNTIIFNKVKTTAGTDLLSGSTQIDRLVATPNTAPTLEVDMISSASVLDSKTFFLTDKVEEFKGFDDSRIHLVAGTSGSSFYAVGTPESVIPGFTSPLSSKVQLVFDLPNSEDRILGRRTANAGGTSSEFGTSALTGFVYYNFAKARWDQIGLRDPATGAPILHDYACEVNDWGNVDSYGWLINSGTNNYPMQFRPPTSANTNVTYASASNNGMQKVGLPTVASMAPFKTIYHATSSQTLKMSGSLSHPFLLEKAVLEMPFTARHRYDPDFDTKAWFQDNYVFFMYRQQRFINPNDRLDTPTDVSSSARFIVASASCAIYNPSGRTWIPNTATDLTGFAPTNSPAFSASLGVTVNASSPSSLTNAAVTGTMRLEMIPAVTPAQDLGFHSLPNSQNYTIKGNHPSARPFTLANAVVNHMWPGGTTCLPFFEVASGYTGKNGVSASYCVTQSTDTPNNPNPRTFQQFPYSRNLSTFFSNLPIQTFDLRSMKPLGGTNSTFFTADMDGSGSMSPNTVGVNCVESPYLLLPEDELVFGFDAGIGQPIRRSQESPMILTSSFLTLKAGAGKLTLFGSMIIDNKEYYPSSNQSLTTVEVHEALHYDNPVLDQFQIENDDVFSGSNQEETIAGRYGIKAWDNRFAGGFTGDRKVIGSRSRGTMGTTGSLQRFDRHPSQDETFKDTKIKNSAVYRYDRFGHYRDMLEQPKDGRFAENVTSKKGTRISPIYIRFIVDGEPTDPSNTFSQNLSIYATSSTPYTDRPGSTLADPQVGSDRPDIADKTLSEYVDID